MSGRDALATFRSAARRPAQRAAAPGSVRSAVPLDFVVCAARQVIVRCCADAAASIGRTAQRVVARRGDLSDLSAQLSPTRTATASATCRASPRSSITSRRSASTAIWLSPFFTSPMRDFGYDVADYRDVDPIFGTLADFDALVERAHALGLKVIIDQVYSHTSDQHRVVQARAASSRDNPRPTGTSGPTPSPTARRPTTGSRCSAARPGPGTRGAASITCTISCPSSRTSTCTIPRCRTRCSTCARFWLDRGVDGFRLDAINFAMHDPAAARQSAGAGRRQAAYAAVRFPAAALQPVASRHSAFLERIRDADRQLSAIASPWPRSAASDAEAEMQRLHQRQRRAFNSAYGFDFLYADRLTPALVARALAAMARCGWRGLAELGVLEPRRAARRFALGRARTIATRSRASRCCCWRACAAISSSIRARSSACRRRHSVRPAAGSRGDRQLAADAGPRRRAHADAVDGSSARRSASRRASRGCRSARSIARSRSTVQEAIRTRARVHAPPARAAQAQRGAASAGRCRSSRRASGILAFERARQWRATALRVQSRAGRVPLAADRCCALANHRSVGRRSTAGVLRPYAAVIAEIA